MDEPKGMHKVEKHTIRQVTVGTTPVNLTDPSIGTLLAKYEVQIPWRLVVINEWESLNRLIIDELTRRLAPEDDDTRDSLWQLIQGQSPNGRLKLLGQVLAAAGTPAEPTLVQAVRDLYAARNLIAHTGAQDEHPTKHEMTLHKHTGPNRGRHVVISYDELAKAVEKADEFRSWLQKMTPIPWGGITYEDGAKQSWRLEGEEPATKDA